MARGTSNRNGVQGEHDVEPRRREGSIVRIKMKDFITYDSVECVPGESLNVLIGPNGTGKSTVLSAIVLGLGGKPTLLGKPQSHIQEFIKNNRQEAQIEIELYREKKNTIVKRTILKDGKTIWNLNGQHATLKDIEAETKRLRIQIDNLCQVLPQDRVQDFAKLNKQELLAETQKAVGKEDMANIHVKLKDLQKQVKHLQVQIHSDKKKKEIEEREVERLKGAVDKMERRKGIVEEAEYSRLKRNIMIYKIKKDEVDKKKTEHKEALDKVNSIKALLEPYKDQIAGAKRKFETVKNRQSGMNKRVRNQVDEVSRKRTELEVIRDKILQLESEREKQLKDIDQQRHEEEAVRQKISKIRNDISSHEQTPIAEVSAKLANLKQEMEKLAEKIGQLSTRKSEMEYGLRMQNENLNEVQRKLAQVRNQRGQRLKLLEEVSAHAARAADWVEKNKNLFHGPVYLPMVVELDVHPDFSKYIENAIGYQDLVAIICESAEDTKLVVDNCRKRLGLRVNVLQADPGEAPEPNISLETLRQTYPGFEGYLKDYVKGPSTLINFLCQRKGFHSVPVSRRDIEAADIPKYYSNDLRKGFIKARYSSNKMFTSDPIGPSRYFTSMRSDTDEDSLKAQISEIEKEIKVLQVDLKEIDVEVGGLNERRNKIRDAQRNLEQSKTTQQTMKFQLSRHEKQLEQMQRKRLDPDSIKQKFLIEIRRAVVELAAAQEPFLRTLKELDALLVENFTIEFEVQNAKLSQDHFLQSCKKEQDALEKAERDAERINVQLGTLRTEATSCVREIESKHRKKVSVIWQENESVFKTLPNSIEELETHIEDKLAHAEMLGGGNEKDTILRFQEHVKTVDRLKQLIEENEVQAAQLVENMETTKSRWKTDLEELVEAISSKFSRYFSEMKCAGEVALFTGNSEHDYDNYGLRIRVKFRASEELQDLNAHTQSGGERAVSTAIYMLSLQDLTPAPFRLVDEINQGMDAINERRVYELLLNSTSRPGSPQYFLLTPKLLKDMKYNPGTTVLCVMNAACAPNHKTWDLNKFISLRKQRTLNNSTHSSQMDVEDDD